MEQRFMQQLQEQKEIQRTLEEKLHSMTQDTMGLPTKAPTAPRVSTRGSCFVVEPTESSRCMRVIGEDDEMAEAEDDRLSKLMTRLPRYIDTIIVDQGRSSIYGFVEPQTIQPSGLTGS
ncbi:hypothetical protein LR48_Vigan304s003400 [Vigna angularis]|uniref:Uncharacterized protein n=1 Tax=Phaseolus angularis TaxID=3914 RepID=A0A0L9T7X0_PHAAN|nr:hypothetical protein LR48_Vigan304s003400 [Vigna angularis]